MKKKKVFLITFIILFFIGPISTWNSTGFEVGGPLVAELGIVYRISWLGGLKIVSALVFGSIFSFVQPGHDLSPGFVNTLRSILFEYNFRLGGFTSWVYLLAFSGIGAAIFTVIISRFKKDKISNAQR